MSIKNRINNLLERLYYLFSRKSCVLCHTKMSKYIKKEEGVGEVSMCGNFVFVSSDSINYKINYCVENVVK